MSTAKLGKNVEAYDPETDPAKIDFESLRLRGWPRSVLDCMQELQRPGSHDLLGAYVMYNPKPEAAE
jgi:hypothetical protein